MVIFHSYVKLPEGNIYEGLCLNQLELPMNICAISFGIFPKRLGMWRDATLREDERPEYLRVSESETTPWTQKITEYI